MRQAWHRWFARTAVDGSRAVGAGWYRWFVLVATCLSFSVGSMLVAIHSGQVAADRERAARRLTEKAMCLIVVTLDGTYRANPPSTETGRKVAAGMAALRTAYRCDEK